MASFTVRDTPAVVERIERDLATIRDRVTAADPGLRSLVLTGGFARGEGAVVAGTPQNDYDLVAIRSGLRPSRVPYSRIRKGLEETLGLHVDLAPVGAWRLPRVSPSIFWYETALRGQVLWGEDLLARIPVRAQADLDRAEGLRLLVNRAAGLLLALRRPDPEPHLLRLQAAKALLAVLDAHLLAAFEFPPSQRERWELFEALAAEGRAPKVLVANRRLLAWAWGFKVAPDQNAAKDGPAAWNAARRALLATVPTALRHAGFTTLAEYERRDGLVDHLAYVWRASDHPDTPRFMLHPTGKVRVATLKLLEAAKGGRLPRDAAVRAFANITPPGRDPLETLERLREATLQ